MELNIDTIVKIATILTGLGAIWSLWYLAKQLQISAEENKTQRSYEYMKRYNNPEFREIRTTAIEFLKDDHATDGQKIDNLKNNPELRSKVLLTLNFFEEMGIMYNKTRLDKKLIKDFFKSISKRCYSLANTYIQELHKLPVNQDNFINWEIMNRDF